MKIDKFNANIINSEVYIHDDILADLRFDRFTRILHLSMIKQMKGKEKSYDIDFINVIGFEMTACNFWGWSPHVYNFELPEEDGVFIIPKLFNMKNENKYDITVLKQREDYIETQLIFISGDKLIVACESIEISETR